jgi:hypothetical protein
MTLLIWLSELVDESGVSFCRHHSTMVLHAHISTGGVNNRLICGHSSDTQSHPIDMLMIIIIIIMKTMDFYSSKRLGA